MAKPDINEPCPKNEDGCHITPNGQWECIFCGAERPGEEFYFGGMFGGTPGKYFIDKNGCRKIGEIPEDVKRRNAEEFAKLIAMRDELGLSDDNV